MSGKRNSSVSELAVQRLEESGYMNSIRAEMKAEVMKCLVEMEEEGEIPQTLRVKRFTPQDDGDYQSLGLVAEFLRFHHLEHTLECLKAETNGDIPVIRGGGSTSELAAAIKRGVSDEEDNPLFR